MPGVLHISWTPGDVEKFEPIYNEDKRESAGTPGRGEDWGVPLTVIQHICGWSDDTMYIVDMFKDEQTTHDLIFAPENLAEDLRTVASGPSMWSKLGVITPSKRDVPAVENLRISKVVPPVVTELTDHGGHRRIRS
jgi:hypothetical protein